jgi:hypothetical protein
MVELMRQQMSHGDLIVNMDLLYSALYGLPDYVNPDALFFNVTEVHNVLIDNIKSRLGSEVRLRSLAGFLKCSNGKGLPRKLMRN